MAEERGLSLMHLNQWFGIGEIFPPAVVQQSLISTCGGKATSRKVEMEHWNRSQL